MATTYSLRTRILSSNPYKNIYENYGNSESTGNSSNYWILIFLLIVLILVAVFVGSIYNTQGYYKEGFEDGTSNPKNKGNNHTLYFFYMNNCKWCDDFKSGAWSKLKSDMLLKSNEYLFEIEELNINERDSKGSRLAEKYKVNSTPTLILVDNDDEDKFKIFDRDRNMVEDLKNFGNKK